MSPQRDDLQQKTFILPPSAPNPMKAVAPNMPPNRLPEDFNVPKVWGHPEVAL
ncbi:MAG: hypothetical protein OSB19_17440 [Opitutaceae bacterium]|nr:hypothetical protein [Opitutaceae bacterium]